MTLQRNRLKKRWPIEKGSQIQHNIRNMNDQAPNQQQNPQQQDQELQKKQELARSLKEAWDYDPESFPEDLKKYVEKYLPKE